MMLAPMTIPTAVIMLDDNLMLCGIKFKKDIDNITPAANASMLNMKRLEGYFIIPNAAPSIGPINDINNKIHTVFIF
jgi:hypothetical protein